MKAGPRRPGWSPTIASHTELFLSLTAKVIVSSELPCPGVLPTADCQFSMRKWPAEGGVHISLSLSPSLSRSLSATAARRRLRALRAAAVAAVAARCLSACSAQLL
eukprot:COSAG03_NODE_792_length_5834_cov_22.439058_1_plen_106_part_00